MPCTHVPSTCTLQWQPLRTTLTLSATRRPAHFQRIQGKSVLTCCFPTGHVKSGKHMSTLSQQTLPADLPPYATGPVAPPPFDLATFRGHVNKLINYHNNFEESALPSAIAQSHLDFSYQGPPLHVNDNFLSAKSTASLETLRRRK